MTEANTMEKPNEKVAQKGMVFLIRMKLGKAAI